MRWHALLLSLGLALGVFGLISGALAADAPKKKIVFLAGGPSHGFGAHDHLAGCHLLAEALKSSLGYDTVVHYKNWPKELSAYDGADCVVMYSDGGGGHPVRGIMETMDAVAKRGTGIVCIHYAVEIPKGSEGGDAFLNWIGGYFEMNWSVNPHWIAEFTKFPDHPICRGVKPFKIDDEWYYHMRFRPDMKDVTPILSCLPPASTLSRADGTHSGNPDVRKAVAAGEVQHVAWAAERPGGGRGFGFTGGHNHWNWGDENFRKVVLNAITWCAKGEVPEGGVGSKPVTVAQLLQNPDETIPANFDAAGIAKKFNIQLGEPKAVPLKNAEKPDAPKPSSGASKALYSSPTVTKQTPGQAVKIDVEIPAGSKKLYLVVNDGGNGFGCDWADWAEPRLIVGTTDKKLTELKWKAATAGHGEVTVNKNCGGNALKIAGQSVEYGIGTHANSIIEYDLPEGTTRFVARGGLDNGGTDQPTCGDGASVQFQLFLTTPPAFVVAADNPAAAAQAAGHEPEKATAGLDVADGLEVKLVASEPELKSLTNLDIDARGRIWVCEVMNYRGNNGKRPEGDRILILEDKDGDGKADSTKVFYQGRDIDSAMGICVLGNKVIVSCSPNIIVFTDENGDDMPDKKEMLFTKTGGAQHDHSAHSFIPGPDGKLYWNFGNTGGSVSDKDGKIVVDRMGREVRDNGKPYWGGMPFRCDLDGGNFEVLAHNFRNNYEVTVDSFGTLWQSDNDDDGNKAVRINYVMEGGNFGYREELTGAGWQAKRTNMEADIPSRHWHLNDPGVVPNLLITGAGSPTGICVYEGRLLPKVFWDQVIHCDAGPNVVRAYVATKDGAGYKAEIVNVLHGARDNWFRPADVCTAPDGSLFVTDWYDPGVGGHGQRDLDRGRLFRVAPPGSKYTVPKFDFATVEGCIEALQNPCLSVRYLAFEGLQKQGEKSLKALQTLFTKNENPRTKARAAWAAAKILAKTQAGAEKDVIDDLMKSENPDLRIVAIRVARQAAAASDKFDLAGVLKKLASDKDPQVRRDVALALRGSKLSDAPAIWAELAELHDGKDRWYLEALGIGAENQWDAFLDAYLKRVGDKWLSPSGKDVIWRSRAKVTPDYLAKIVKDPGTPADTHPKYMRAFDFLPKSPEKDKALESLLGL